MYTPCVWASVTLDELPSRVSPFGEMVSTPELVFCTSINSNSSPLNGPSPGGLYWISVIRTGERVE